MMDKNNPYNRFLVDEASGIQVLNEKWVTWEDGYASCLAEFIKDGTYGEEKDIKYTAWKLASMRERSYETEGEIKGWLIFIKETREE